MASGGGERGTLLHSLTEGISLGLLTSSFSDLHAERCVLYVVVKSSWGSTGTSAEVLTDCGQKLRQFCTLGNLVFPNLSQDKMSISSAHLIADFSICPLHTPAAFSMTSLSCVFAQCFIFAALYFIPVFSAAAVIPIKNLTEAA